MLRRIGRRHHVVVAYLALFVALGGSSYAAIKVTGKNVKDSSLTGKDIKNSSLGEADVENGSLLAADFKAGQLPGGPQGVPGARGAAGATGPQGAKGDPCAPSDPRCRGPKGDTGATGAAGPAGPAGPQGPRGATGLQGPKGDPGAPATRLWAQVTHEGQLAANSGAVSAEREREGVYILEFNRPVEACARVVTSGTTTGVDQFAPSIVQTLAGGTGVRVDLFLYNGNRTDGSFNIAVFC